MNVYKVKLTSCCKKRYERNRAGGYTPATVHVPDGTTRRVLYRFVNPMDLATR